MIQEHSHGGHQTMTQSVQHQLLPINVRSEKLSIHVYPSCYYNLTKYSNFSSHISPQFLYVTQLWYSVIPATLIAAPPHHHQDSLAFTAISTILIVITSITTAKLVSQQTSSTILPNSMKSSAAAPYHRHNNIIPITDTITTRSVGETTPQRNFN